MAKNHPPWFLNLIIFKLFIQGIFVLPLGIGLFTLIDGDLEKIARGIIQDLHLDLEGAYISLLLEKIAIASPTHLLELSIGLFLYGTLCMVESYGLYKRRRWAEYLTVGAVSLFIPFELYYIFQSVTFLRVAILVLNVAIVAYLIQHKELFSRKITPSTK